MTLVKIEEYKSTTNAKIPIVPPKCYEIDDCNPTSPYSDAACSEVLKLIEQTQTKNIFGCTSVQRIYMAKTKIFVKLPALRKIYQTYLVPAQFDLTQLFKMISIIEQSIVIRTQIAQQFANLKLY